MTRLALNWSRYTALIFAIGLAIGEAVINWGHWQYAPLWIVDYICVAWLLAGFYLSRDGKNLAALIGGWAFTSGVFYMALFISLDPQIAQHFERNPTLLAIVGGMLVLAGLGVLTAWHAHRRRSR
jgi:hypothetical protein